MKRKSFISTSAAAAGAAIGAASVEAVAATGSASQASTMAERAPFIAIAKAKGVKITFAEMGAKSVSGPPPADIHLDMKMIEASIDLAAKRAQASGQKTIAAKLERLGASGTAAQKTDFVMGSGTYYFPEDIEKATAQGTVQLGKTCEYVCTVVCWCLTNGDQNCRDICRYLCSGDGA